MRDSGPTTSGTLYAAEAATAYNDRMELQAEVYFTDMLSPDFDRHALFAALEDYESRARRFGGLS